MGRKPILDKKKTAEFNKRLLGITDKIPTDYINMVLQRKPELNANRIRMVRYGTTKDFSILEILEDITKK